jgi:hypothetical protein
MKLIGVLDEGRNLIGVHKSVDAARKHQKGSFIRPIEYISKTEMSDGIRDEVARDDWSGQRWIACHNGKEYVVEFGNSAAYIAL